MSDTNAIGDFHNQANVDAKKNKEEYDREALYSVLNDGVTYRCKMVWDEKKGKRIEIPDWSGTTFTARTKDGHERTYTLRHTDIRDKDELNKMILTMRKFVNDLTLAQTAKVVNGKTFSITEKLGNASNYVCLLRLNGRLGFVAIVTGSRYHRTPLGFGSARINNKQGFYGLDLGRLMPGQNGWLKSLVYSIVNGYTRGSAGKVINMANPYLHEKLQFVTGGLLLVDMNKVAGNVKKYGKTDKLWEAFEKLQLDNQRRVTEEPRPVEVDLLGDKLDILAADLVERNYMLKAKQTKLQHDQLWGLEISEALKAEIKTLQEDVAGLHQAILFRKMDNEDQKMAIEGMSVLWQMRKQIRNDIAEERNAHDLAHVDTHQMEQQEQRLQRAINQIQEIIRLRTVLMLQAKPNPDHFEALKGAQNALLQFPADVDPQDLAETMNSIDRQIDRGNAIGRIDRLIDQVKAIVSDPKDEALEWLAIKHKCTIEMLTDAQVL